MAKLGFKISPVTVTVKQGAPHTLKFVFKNADGMTCDKIRPQSLVFYAPLVRDLIDVKGGLTITNNNTATVANHPRVYA
jgi:hypothetical protein